MPDNPKLAATGKAICPCAYNNFHGRHYDNTLEGWQLHIQSKMHQNWRRAELEKLSEGESGRQAVVAAHALPWFAQERCIRLQFIFGELNVNASIGKRFVKAQTTDADVPMLLMMTDERWMLDFGMQPGQVKAFKSVAWQSSVSCEDIVPFEEAIYEQLHSWDWKKRCIQNGVADWTDEEVQQRSAMSAEFQSWIDNSIRFLQAQVVEPLQQQHEEIAGEDLGPGYNGFEAAEDVLEAGATVEDAEDAAKRRAKRKRSKNKY